MAPEKTSRTRRDAILLGQRNVAASPPVGGGALDRQR